MPPESNVRLLNGRGVHVLGSEWAIVGPRLVLTLCITGSSQARPWKVQKLRPMYRLNLQVLGQDSSQSTAHKIIIFSSTFGCLLNSFGLHAYILAQTNIIKVGTRSYFKHRVWGWLWLITKSKLEHGGNYFFFFNFIFWFILRGTCGLPLKLTCFFTEGLNMAIGVLFYYPLIANVLPEWSSKTGDQIIKEITHKDLHPLWFLISSNFEFEFVLHMISYWSFSSL